MRKVKIYDWQKDENKKPLYTSPIEIGEGIFHAFGVSYEEFEGGPGNYQIAIIEMSDGSIKEIPLNLIRFIDDEDTKIAEDNAEWQKINSDLVKQINKLKQKTIDQKTKLDHYENLIAEIFKLIKKYGVSKMWD